MEFSLQLWSVENVVKDKGMADTLKMVKEHGYSGVEFAGFADMTAEDMQAELDKNNLYAVGSHTDMKLFKNSLRENLEYHKKIGAEYMIIPWCDYSNGMESVQGLIDLLNDSSVIAKEYGIKVGFHTHEPEFRKIDGKYIIDIIADGINDDVVLELDVYWIAFAGEDPYEYIEKLGKKVELIHMKQLGKDNSNVLLADGVIDFKKVVECAKYSKYFIVEQGDIEDQEDASLKNAEFLKKILA